MGARCVNTQLLLLRTIFYGCRHCMNKQKSWRSFSTMLRPSVRCSLSDLKRETEIAFRRGRQQCEIFRQSARTQHKKMYAYVALRGPSTSSGSRMSFLSFIGKNCLVKTFFTYVKLLKMRYSARMIPSFISNLYPNENEEKF